MTSKTNIFSKIGEKWFKKISFNCKISTYTRYRTILDKHLYPVFGEKEMKEIRQEEIMEFLKEKCLTYKYNTVCAIRVVLHSVMNYGYDWSVIKKIPDECFRIKKKNTQITSLTESEARCLNKSLMDSENLLDVGILIALNTGLRLGEVCALRWNNIDLIKKSLTVLGTVQRVYESNGNKCTKVKVLPPKTRFCERIIPLEGSILLKLRTLKCVDNCYVLSGSFHPVEPRVLQKRFKMISEKLIKRHVKFHDLRHTFATICISNGGDVKAVSEILGHKDVSTTLSFYKATNFEDKQKAIRKLKRKIDLKDR